MPRRTVDTAIWNDRRFSELSSSAKLVYLRLITGDDTGAAGATTVTPKRLAVDAELEKAAVEGALEELVEAGLVRRYGDEWLWLPAWIRYQVHGPNFIRAVRRQARECPESLRKAIGRAVDGHVGTKDRQTEAGQETSSDAGVSERVAQRSDKGRGTLRGEGKDQDQDQDLPPLRGKEGPSGQEQTREGAAASPPPSPGAKAPPPDAGNGGRKRDPDVEEAKWAEQAKRELLEGDPWKLRREGEDDAATSARYPRGADESTPPPPELLDRHPIIRNAVRLGQARGRGDLNALGGGPA